jgi:hypothetical protein
LASHDHPARPHRPVRKRRPRATATERTGATRVHQAIQAGAFWYQVSLHKMGPTSTSDVRLDRGPVPSMPGGFPPACCCREAWTHETSRSYT